MPTSTHQLLPAGQLLSRDLLISILNAAVATGEYRFARLIALAWLTDFPGDLPVNLIYAQALVQEGHPEQALPILNELCMADPEFVEAVEALYLTQAQFRIDNQRRSKRGYSGDGLSELNISGMLLALGGDPTFPKNVPPADAVIKWSRLLGRAISALERGHLARADEILHQTLAAQPDTPLVASIHLKILQSQIIAEQIPPQTLRDLARHYHQLWPDCLHCTLILADSMMDGGKPEEAVELLHQAAAHDLTGQVATRLWGDHPYRSLWPEHLEIILDMTIPAAVAAALGWNLLSPGDPLPLQTTTNRTPVKPARRSGPLKRPGIYRKNSVRTLPPGNPTLQHEKRPAPTYSKLPESLLSVQAELERIGNRLNLANLVRSDGRFPVYVVLTTKRGLEAQYGKESAAKLDAQMKRLVETVQARRDWKAMLIYTDEPGFTSKMGLKPARSNDPWGIKLALVDLDSFLKRHGEMIGAVLIVGGPEVVPFHHLPNPVDDTDIDVPSDNPYSTRDGNYFIPEWPVGRLVGGIGTDAKPLLRVLDKLISRHTEQNQRRRIAWYQSLWKRILTWIGRFRPARPSLGYTAAVWKRASLSVFRPIGPSGAMWVSPPVQAPQTGKPVSAWRNRLGPKPKPGSRRHTNGFLPAAKLGYFNLHGLEDSSEWYGQREHAALSDGLTDGGTNYPVALRPQDIVNSGRAPQVVFTEACFGAHILGKTTEEAMALKFLQAGSQAVVGSTCISYGSIDTPLIAADFLGQAFWKYLREALPAGEALRRAKISLAREMHRRQGYLDGEDQKTLISFVLYGDPLAQPLGLGSQPKAVLRPINPPTAIQTVCDRGCETNRSQPISPELLDYVKQIVEQYLPGMEDAHLMLRNEQAVCHKAGQKCPMSQIRDTQAKLWKDAPQQPRRRVVVLNKRVTETGSQSLSHNHYARLTLDAEGKLVKLAVSR